MTLGGSRSIAYAQNRNQGGCIQVGTPSAEDEEDEHKIGTWRLGTCRKRAKTSVRRGKAGGLLRLMDDHDDERVLTILYATESGGAQDAANKIARRCRDLNFECRNINVRDYPLVRAIFFFGKGSAEPGLIIR